MTGEELYDAYRAERVRQGWEEWKWTSLNKPQQTVWERLAATLQPKEKAPTPFPTLLSRVK